MGLPCISADLVSLSQRIFRISCIKLFLITPTYFSFHITGFFYQPLGFIYQNPFWENGFSFTRNQSSSRPAVKKYTWIIRELMPCHLQETGKFSPKVQSLLLFLSCFRSEICGITRTVNRSGFCSHVWPQQQWDSWALTRPAQHQLPGWQHSAPG